MATPAKNTVLLNPAGYIDVIITGDQTYLSFDQIRADVKPLMEERQRAGQPVRGLVDLTGMTHFDVGSNRAALEILEILVYDRVAMYGGNPAVTEITHLILEALGKTEQTKIFPDRASALAWLTS